MSFLAAAAPTIGAVGSLVGTGISAYGQYRENQEVAKAANYNVQVGQNQSILVGQAGELNVERIRRTAKQIMGAQRAAYGAAGVALSGSALDVLSDTASQVEQDILIEKYNTAIQQSAIQGQVAMDQYQANVAKKSAWLRPAATVLSGGARALTNFYA